MAFQNTLVSLFGVLDNSESSNFVTTSEMNNRFTSATENVVSLTPSNNTITINPANSTLFSASISANTTIAISSPSSLYSINGAVISLLLTLSSDGLAVNFPNSVSWVGGDTPTLGTNNLITFITLNGGSTWYAESLDVSGSN